MVLQNNLILNIIGEMKKIIYCLFIMVGLCSCDRGHISDGTFIKHFNASIDFSTKTFRDQEGKTMWSTGDKIVYYSSDNGPLGTHVVEEDGRYTDISASLRIEDTYFIAVYGAQSVETYTGSSLKLKDAVKSAQSGTFAKAHVSIGRTATIEDQNLVFSNITSLIKFSLTRNDIDYLVFSSNDNTPIHGNGEVVIEFSGSNKITASYGNNVGNSITVKNLKKGTFYISTLPTTLKKGFNINYYNSDGKLIGETKTSSSLSIPQNTIVSLGALDAKITKPIINLSELGTANCYIVSEAGTYKFKTVQGKSSTSVGAVASASLLWCTYNNSTAPTAKSLVKDISYKDNYITFSTPDTFKQGNAIIAAKDASGKILWSWHIWLCSGIGTTLSPNNNITILDRNLGALSKEVGNALSLGFLYQWGRKDPFPSGSTIGSINAVSSTMATTYPQGTITKVSRSESTGTIAYTLAHPTTVISEPVAGGSWLWDGTTNGKLWQTNKTRYDPCPPGWKVPDHNKSWVQNNWEEGKDYTTNWENHPGHGLYLYKNSWYPAVGYYEYGSLRYVGNHGLYWTNSTIGGNGCKNAYAFSLSAPGYTYYTYRYTAHGGAIRCCKE